MTDRRDLPGYWAQGEGMHFPEARSPGHAVRLYREAFARAEVAVVAGPTVDGLEVAALRRRVAALEGEVRRLTGDLAQASKLHCTICGAHHGGQFSAPASWSHTGPGKRPKERA